MENIHLIPFLLEGVGGVDSLMQMDGIHPNESGHRIVAGERLEMCFIRSWKYCVPGMTLPWKHCIPGPVHTMQRRSAGPVFPPCGVAAPHCRNRICPYMEKLTGLIAAPYTPMHPDGSVHSGIIPDMAPASAKRRGCRCFYLRYHGRRRLFDR